LLGSLEDLARDAAVQGGAFTAIGAVRKAAFSFYDQSSHRYVPIKMNEGMEIVSCSGTFGVLNGSPKIHCHVAFSNREGLAFGGHLIQGTEVFVGEVHLTEVDGVKLERRVEQETGMAILDF
jgi:hypothetical protein